MLTGVRHIAIPMLGCVVLVVVACEGSGSALENQFLGPPTAIPNVEVTVESRLNEERAKEEAIEATAEAKAQVMAISIAETTAQAVPTSEPLPTTSATPEPGENIEPGPRLREALLRTYREKYMEISR